MNLAILELETIERLGGRFAGTGQPGANREFRLRLRQQSQALLQGTRDKKNITAMRIDIAHQLFNPFAGRPLAITEVMSNGGLQIFSEHIGGAVSMIVHLSAHPKEEVIGVFKL